MNASPQPYTPPRKVAVLALVLAIAAIGVMPFYWPVGFLMSFLSLILAITGRKGPGRRIARGAMACAFASLFLWFYITFFVGIIFNPYF